METPRQQRIFALVVAVVGVIFIRLGWTAGPDAWFALVPVLLGAVLLLCAVLLFIAAGGGSSWWARLMRRVANFFVETLWINW